MAIDGLTDAEAARRFAREGPNALPGSHRRTWPVAAWDAVREPMIALLLVAAAAYGSFGDPRDAAALVVSALAVAAIAAVQEVRSSRALEALRDLSSPRALVIRNGAPVRIAGSDVVRGDIVLLYEGDRVPADARIEAGSTLRVDESLLTGEAIPVFKDVGATVYSGTLVVSGSARAEVTAIGLASRIGKIGGTLAGVARIESPLQRDLARLTTRIAIFATGICLIVAIAFGIRHGDWRDGLLAGLSSAISLLPEEIPIVLASFFAMGAWRIARARVLTRRLSAIEALGSATVLCSDKTGTLTMNRMRVALAESDDERVLAETARLACEANPVDPMEQAIRSYADAVRPDGAASMQLEKVYPLERRYFAVTYVYRDITGARRIAVKGAPEVILQQCALAAPERERLQARVTDAASRGFRVIFVAEGLAANEPLPDDPRAFQLAYRGMLALEDPVRDGVPEAVATCVDAGVRVMMITGDHASTASAIARSIGLANADDVLGGDELDGLPDDVLAARLRDVNVFARVTPDGKLRLVNALAAQGAVVAMTGDGVNDAPALKAAHIGIAMGARGTDVARESASLVLLDDDFTSIARAIALGRRIYDNIRSSLGYIVVVHLLVAGLALIPAFTPLPLLLLPIDIVFIELIIDPTCAIAFEAEPAAADAMQRPPRAPNTRILSPRAIGLRAVDGIAALIAPLGSAAYAAGTGAPDDAIRSLALAAFLVSNGIVVYAGTSRANRVALGVLAGSFIAFGLIYGVPVLREIFHLAVPTRAQLAALAAVCLVGAGAQFTLFRFTRK